MAGAEQEPSNRRPHPDSRSEEGDVFTHDKSLKSMDGSMNKTTRVRTEPTFIIIIIIIHVLISFL